MDKDKPLTAGKLSLLFHPNIFSYNQSLMGHIFKNVVIIPITHNNILQCLEFEQCCAVVSFYMPPEEIAKNLFIT